MRTAPSLAALWLAGLPGGDAEFTATALTYAR